MEHLVGFVKTLLVSVCIAFLMFVLLHFESVFRSDPQGLPTPPYVSVTTQIHSQTPSPWWQAVLFDIRFGN